MASSLRRCAGNRNLHAYTLPRIDRSKLRSRGAEVGSRSRPGIWTPCPQRRSTRSKSRPTRSRWSSRATSRRPVAHVTVSAISRSGGSASDTSTRSFPASPGRVSRSRASLSRSWPSSPARTSMPVPPTTCRCPRRGSVSSPETPDQPVTAAAIEQAVFPAGRVPALRRSGRRRRGRSDALPRCRADGWAW